MLTSATCSPSTPSSPDRSGTRASLLAGKGVRHLGGKMHGKEHADAIACTAPDRNSCFAVLFWSGDRLDAAEVFHTKREALAVLDHGRVYALRSLALPEEVLRCLGDGICCS